MDRDEPLIASIVLGALAGGAVGAEVGRVFHRALTPVGAIGGAYVGAIAGPLCYVLGVVSWETIRSR